MILDRISIHAARVGCDPPYNVSSVSLPIFQSTQPEWAATGRYKKRLKTKIISIHAARVGCDDGTGVIIDRLDGISIHAARVGCDTPKP